MQETTVMAKTQSFSLPLPIYKTVRIGTLLDKNGREFDVLIGLNEDQVQQLQAYSLDESDTDIQLHTSDRQRFGEGSYEEWYGKDRTPFALIEKDSGTLAAIAWFGPKPIGRKSLRFLSEEERAQESEQESQNWYTIVYRSYKPFRGAGLMTEFVSFAMRTYREHFPNAKLWAGISTKNQASMALATKLGFELDPAYVDEKAHWCAMIEK